MSKCWRRVEKIFSGFLELYQNVQMYNCVGLYVDLMNRKEGNVDEYKSKSDNETYLRIYYELSQMLNLSRDERMPRIKEKIRERIFGTGDIKSCIKTKIKYDKDAKPEDKPKVIWLLMLYNVARMSKTKVSGRFNFVANAQNHWEREHICAWNVEIRDKKTGEVHISEEELKEVLTVLSGDSYRKYLEYIEAEHTMFENEKEVKEASEDLLKLIEKKETIEDINDVSDEERKQIRISWYTEVYGEDFNKDSSLKKWLGEDETIEAEQESQEEKSKSDIQAVARNWLKRIEKKEDINAEDMWRETWQFYTEYIVKEYEKKKIEYVTKLTEWLRDNQMGNMTLLTGNEDKEKVNSGNVDMESKSQNQEVGKKIYKSKRKQVYDFYKEGQFVPLGTLFVFMGMFSYGSKADALWLPDSRLTYVKDMEEVVINFFDDKETN